MSITDWSVGVPFFCMLALFGLLFLVNIARKGGMWNIILAVGLWLAFFGLLTIVGSSVWHIETVILDHAIQTSQPPDTPERWWRIR